MIAAWGEDSDDSDFETDICKNEVANLCLMALEDEVNDNSFPFDKLQTAFDELHDEFKKLSLKSNCQKKIIFSFSQENEFLTSKINTLENEVLTMEKEKKFSKEKEFLQKKNKILKNEKVVLNENIEDLKNILSKFTRGRDTLNKILKSQTQTFG